ncbi:methylthioribose-1-phosphate isomerase [Paenibacillus sp. JCM 10914]|nr:methylthioribose-1-phosphate isomerase [Paenibacillus sp. JCM 10914]
MSGTTNTAGSLDIHEPLSSVFWGGDHLVLLDQRLLPEEIVFLKLFTPEEVWDAFMP